MSLVQTKSVDRHPLVLSVTVLKLCRCLCGVPDKKEFVCEPSSGWFVLLSGQ